MLALSCNCVNGRWMFPLVFKISRSRSVDPAEKHPCFPGDALSYAVEIWIVYDLTCKFGHVLILSTSKIVYSANRRESISRNEAKRSGVQ